jgi:hypothetical protein
MFRHVLRVAAIAALTSTYAVAAERATFILTDGARKSGAVAFHGAAHENLINGNLNIGTDNGAELTIPLNQVAVIDFVGGAPATAELDSLPADNTTHLLILRGGTPQLGHFVNLVDGETLRWRNLSGQDQQYAIRDVTRIYLNPQSARVAFNYTPGAVGTTGQALSPVTIHADARQAWTDTGITVKKGQHVSFRATGQIQFAPGSGDISGPDGNSAFRRTDYPLPSVPAGALIGRIDNGAPFGIGSQSQPLPMPATGRLLIGVNDSIFSDNSGAYSVVVTPSSN